MDYIYIYVDMYTYVQYIILELFWRKTYMNNNGILNILYKKDEGLLGPFQCMRLKMKFYPSLILQAA